MPTTRYYKISPRGFANEVRYIRIVDDEQARLIEAEYGEISDRDPAHKAFSGWTSDRRARVPGVSVAFEDRNFV